MAISYFPLTINVSQIVGKAVTNAVLTIGTNLPAGTPIAFGDEIAVPGGLYRLPGGVGSVNLPTKAGATNVSDWQYVVTGEYQLDGVVKRLAPVYIDAPTAATARNLASFVGVTSVPATFMGAAVAQLQAKVDEANAAADRAAAIGDIATTDDAVDVALKLPGSKSAATVEAAIIDSRDTLYAKDFGVKPGNSGTQNAANLTALLAGINTTSGPVTIKAEAGVHNFASQVVLNVPGVVLQADGATTFRAVGVAAPNQAVMKITANNVEVRGDFLLDGNGFATFGIHATDVEGLRILGPRITGTKFHGTYLKNCNGAYLSGVDAVNCGDSSNTHAAGFYQTDCDNMTMVRCTSTGSYEHGYYLISDGDWGLDDANGLQMIGCQAFGNGNTGISARVNRATLTGCYSWGNAAMALALNPVGQTPAPYKGDKMVLSGCVLGGTTTNALGNEVAITADRVTVTGCTIDASTTQNGLRFIGCDTVTVVGNTIRNTAAAAVAAVRVDSTTNYLLSSNNIVGSSSSVGSGVYVSASSDGLIQGNQIGLFANGIRLAADLSANVKILHNPIRSVTNALSNSSTGAGVLDVGNGLAGSYDVNALARFTKGYGVPPVKQTLAAAGAVTHNAANGDSQVTLNANATSSSITNPADGQVLTISWVQDATGGRTYSWPPTCRFAGGVAPADTTAATRTAVTFRYELFQGRWYELSRAVAVPV